LTKIVAVVGGKHSGKTTVIEHLTAELKRRGHSVGAIKEMVRIPTLDTPETETDRYFQAGAEVIAAVPRDETVVFIKKRLNIKELLLFFEDLDFVILEGFETQKEFPRIIAAKTAEEARTYMTGKAIVISGLISESPNEAKKAGELHVPVFNSLKMANKIADLVEQNALAH
jgi:molybdopterin-guanine dinucleotide biosynthesis protein MobB